MSMVLDVEQWVELGRRIFVSWGSPADQAAYVARTLVDSDLAGIASHGVLRIPQYHEFVNAGWLKPGNAPEIIRDAHAVAVVDGHWGFGQPAAKLATEVAIAKARTSGIAAVGMQRAGHIGRLGEYAEMATRENMIALVMASGGDTGGLLAPHGGAERVFSTNPIGAGVPARRHAPFIMDYATSVVAAGRIWLLPDQDARIPEGWVVDAEGKPATVARKLKEGGAVLPFGGHKGYALSLLVELLCGALTEAGCSARPDRVVEQGLGGNASFIIVIDPVHFVDLDGFYGSVDGFFDRLKKVKPAAGFDRVRVPGEPEAEHRVKHLAAGISVESAIWEQIRAVATAHHVRLDDIVPHGGGGSAAG
jgi:uncharacterized oxidoreductase